MPVYLDVIFKIIAILLSGIAIFQLREVRRKRHIDMYWKIYELYISELQKKARKNTVILREAIKPLIMNGSKRDDIIQQYSKQFHKASDSVEKDIDRSVIDRVRFLNMIGNLLKMSLVNKDMLFELIGLGVKHDYDTLLIVVKAHRQDHYAPQMYSNFEAVMEHYLLWNKKRQRISIF